MSSKRAAFGPQAPQSTGARHRIWPVRCVPAGRLPNWCRRRPRRRVRSICSLAPRPVFTGARDPGATGEAIEPADEGRSRMSDKEKRQGEDRLAVTPFGNSPVRKKAVISRWRSERSIISASRTPEIVAGVADHILCKPTRFLRADVSVAWSSIARLEYARPTECALFRREAVS